MKGEIIIIQSASNCWAKLLNNFNVCVCASVCVCICVCVRKRVLKQIQDMIKLDDQIDKIICENYKRIPTYQTYLYMYTIKTSGPKAQDPYHCRQSTL